MSHVFLSYANEDRDAARRIVGLLESADWSVWWDRRIPAGQSWSQVLDDALAGMRCMVVLWSRHSVDSNWVYEEAEEGRKRGVLLPVLIDAVEPPRGFRLIQAADLSAWNGDAAAPAARQLLTDLTALTRDASTAVPSTRSGSVTAATATPMRAEPHTDTDIREWWATHRLWPVIALALAVLLAAVLLQTLWHSSPVPAPAPPVPGPDVVVDRSGEQSAAASEDVKPPPSADESAKHPELAPSMPAVLPPKPVPTRPVSQSPAAPADAPMCRALLERVSLGDPLNDAEQRFLQKVCRQ
ncbi:MAG: toll/interleukin-1 receptor domain-containing protein [Moraxellaceae bacterium]|nr:toll/interleukin-1 receptor domain-containing protein [Moraxellaceae bacterium]